MGDKNEFENISGYEKYVEEQKNKVSVIYYFMHYNFLSQLSQWG